MKLVALSIVCIFATIFSSCYFFNLTSEPDWDNLTSFKMYAFNYAKPLDDLTDSEMDTLVSIEIPVQEAKQMFKGRVRSTYDILIYKTMILCRLKFKNAPDRRFVISSYGGFFTDLYADRLYKVLPEYSNDWKKFIGGYERKLIDKDYIRQYPNEDTSQWYHGDIHN